MVLARDLLLLATPSLSAMGKAKCKVVSIIRKTPAGHGLIFSSVVTSIVVQSERMRHEGKMCHRIALS